MKTFLFDDALFLPVPLGELFGFFAEAKNLEKLTQDLPVRRKLVNTVLKKDI